MIVVDSYRRPQYVLDSIAGGRFGFSLRRVSASHSGACIRVRRSSDSTEQDIGFNADGTLDEAALYTFCGSGNGFIATWYNQAGTGDAAQATTTKQPQIYASGQIYREPVTSTGSFRPSMLFSSGNCLQVTSITLPTYLTVGLMARLSTRGVFLEQSADAVNNDGLYFAGINNPAALVRRTSSHYILGTSNWFSTGALNTASFSYNGTHIYNLNGVAQTNSTTTGTARSNSDNAAVLNIGSRNNGASSSCVGYFYELLAWDGVVDANAIHTPLSAWGAGSTVEPLVVIGDSTVGTYTSFVSVPSLMKTSYGAKLWNITSVATAGDTIAQQQTRWSALSAGVRSAARIVLAQIGLNDLDPGESAATALGRYQTLINTIAADAPSARIYGCTMIPCRAQLISVYGGTNGPIAYQKWLDMNTAYMASGPNAITGLHGSISQHTDDLNDGSGNLDAAYDSGDGIHENDAGRQVVADSWTTRLVSDGAIP